MVVDRPADPVDYLAQYLMFAANRADILAAEVHREALLEEEKKKFIVAFEKEQQLAASRAQDNWRDALHQKQAAKAAEAELLRSYETGCAERKDDAEYLPWVFEQLRHYVPTHALAGLQSCVAKAKAKDEMQQPLRDMLKACCYMAGLSRKQISDAGDTPEGLLSRLSSLCKRKSENLVDVFCAVKVESDDREFRLRFENAFRCLLPLKRKDMRSLGPPMLAAYDALAFMVSKHKDWEDRTRSEGRELELLYTPRSFQSGTPELEPTLQKKQSQLRFPRIILKDDEKREFHDVPVSLSLSLSSIARQMAERIQQVVVSSYDTKTSSWLAVGMLEATMTASGTVSVPDSVLLNFEFQSVQTIKIEVVDAAVPSGSAQAFHGNSLMEATFQLSALVLSSSHSLQLSLCDASKAKLGAVTVTAVEQPDKKHGFLHLHFSAEDLRNLDGGLFDKSDPFLVLHRIESRPGSASNTAVPQEADAAAPGSSKTGKSSAASLIPCAYTEVIMDCLNPVWQPVKVSVDALCLGNLNQDIVIQCLDWDSDRNFELIGEVRVPVERLAAGAEFNLTNRAKYGAESCGRLLLHLVEYVPEYSFLHFIRSGIEMSLVVAIDFSASNGNPSNKDSLHYIDPQRSLLNPYEKAITGVGEVMLPYDADGTFCAVGFGAKVPPSARVNHCFPVNLSAKGVDAVIDAYHQSLKEVILAGPTCLAPILDYCMQEVRSRHSAPKPKYVVLLVITDGEIADMEEAKRAIVEASSLPMSIIIVGVGNADFTNMEKLDGDNERLSYQDRPALRDIVQFVRYNQIAHLSAGAMGTIICEELPTQFLEYMTLLRRGADLSKS